MILLFLKYHQVNHVENNDLWAQRSTMNQYYKHAMHGWSIKLEVMIYVTELVLYCKSVL